MAACLALGLGWLAVGCPNALGQNSGGLDQDHTAQLTGRPRVVDGNTFEIAGYTLRLAGADAPPGDAVCGRPGHEWRCGMEATMALTFDVAEHWVTCTPLPRRSGEITLARCTLGPYDLAARVVLAGWAMAIEGYAFEEDMARREGKGIWRDGYIPPPRWRGVKRAR